MKLKIECVRDVMEELETFPIGSHMVANLKKNRSASMARKMYYILLQNYLKPNTSMQNACGP